VPEPSAADRFGLRVGRGRCPLELDDATEVGPGLWVSGSAALVALDVAGVPWRILVTDGSQVTVDGPADREPPSWLLESWAVTLAMLQRGRVVLHGTVMEVAGRVVVLAGDSGAGKSTTAAALGQRGHRLLTDDVAVVDLRDGVPWVLPFRRGLHLCDDAADALGLDRGGLARMDGAPGKLVLDPDGLDREPRPIDCVVVLGLGGAEVAVRRLTGAAALECLTTRAGRPLASRAILGPRRHLEAMAAIASAVPVWSVTRPTEGWTAEDVARRVESCR